VRCLFPFDLAEDIEREIGLEVRFSLSVDYGSPENREVGSAPQERDDRDRDGDTSDGILIG